MILAVERHEAAVGNQAREQAGLLDRHHPVALGMNHERGTRDAPRAFRQVDFKGHAQQPDGRIRLVIPAAGARVRMAANIEVGVIRIEAVEEVSDG